MNKEPKSILLIDDDDLLCDLLSSLLELEGYRVTQAGNGIEGLARLKEDSFDLILLDLLMPLMDGVMFLRKLPEHMPAPPPVLVISASASGNVLDVLNVPGVAGILRKPISPPELLVHIAAALSAQK
jgi:CheY-like chemotaxis protein